MFRKNREPSKTFHNTRKSEKAVIIRIITTLETINPETVYKQQDYSIEYVCQHLCGKYPTKAKILDGEHLLNIITYVSDEYNTIKFTDKYIHKHFDISINNLICDLLIISEFCCSKSRLSYDELIFEKNDFVSYCAPDKKRQQLLAFEDFCMNLFAIKYVMIKKLGQSRASKSAANQTIKKTIKYLTKFFDFKPCCFKTRDLLRPLRKLIKENNDTKNNDTNCDYKYLRTIAKGSGYTNITIKNKLPKIKFSFARLNSSVPSFNRYEMNYHKSKSSSDIYELGRKRKFFLKLKF